MLRLATICVLMVSMCTAYAEQSVTLHSPLRAEGSFTRTSADARLNGNELKTKSSALTGLLTYYFRQELFGELGYGKPTLHKRIVNGQIIPTQSSDTNSLFWYGFGFRSQRKGSISDYLGIGFRLSASVGELQDDNSSKTIRLFSQKDTSKRFGLLQVSRETGNNGSINKIGGKHIWFSTNGIGFGLQWALGSGREIDESGIETSYRTRVAGVVMMYRPKLYNSEVLEQ